MRKTQLAEAEKRLEAWKAHARALRFTLRELAKCNCGRVPHSTHCPELRAGAALATKPE